MISGTDREQFAEWLSFKAQLIELWSALRANGVLKPGITDKNYTRFVEMPPQMRSSISQFIAHQIEIYNEADELGIELGDTPDLLKVALQVMGLGVDRKILEQIHRDDVVELYSLEHTQMFRSINFFQLCNYNLDDILMYEWFNLYERANGDTTQIFEQVLGHLKSDDCMTRFTMPKHLMKERFSEQQGVFEIDLKLLASAFKGPGLRDGYVVSQRVKVLDVVDRGRVELIKS